MLDTQQNSKMARYVAVELHSDGRRSGVEIILPHAKDMEAAIDIMIKKYCNDSAVKILGGLLVQSDDSMWRIEKFVS